MMKTVASAWAFAVLCALAVGFSSAATYAGLEADSSDVELRLVVIKSSGGPSRNIVTRDWTSPTTGTWSHWVSNLGLRPLSIEVLEEVDGTSTVIYSCKISFSVANTYPSGIVEIEDILLAKGRFYKLLLEPQGR